MENKNFKNIMTRIDTELDKRMKHHLIDTGQSQQKFISKAIEEKLDREQGGKQK